MPFSPDDRLALLLDATEAGYWEWHSNGTGEIVSPLALQIYGIGEASPVSPFERMRACTHPDDLQRLETLAIAARERGSSYVGDLRITRENDGARRWLRVRGRSSENEQGDVRVLGTVVDVTEERELSSSIDQVRQQLEEAEHLAGIGSWSWQVATGEVHWSRETYRILKVAEDATPSFELVLGLAVDDVHRAEFLEHVQHALVGDRPYDFEIQAHLTDDSVVTIHTRGHVERDATGAPVRMLGTMQDVTAIRAAQRALREREERFRTLAESSPTGILLTDARLIPTYANQRLLDWFDLTFEEYVSGAWADRVHPDDRARAEFDARHRDATHPFETEYRIVVNGAVRWLSMRTEPLFGADGSSAGVVASVLDVSAARSAAAERSRLQAQLQQAQKLESLGLLAGGIAHDFNNLLVSILANASLARLDVPHHSTLADVLADIEQSAQRAAELTRQLLEYGGRASSQRAAVDLVQVVHELPTLLRASVPHGITVRVLGPEEAHTVDGDAAQLRQVLMNLVTNAIDAMRDRSGVIDVHVATAQLTRDDLTRVVLGAEREAGPYIMVTVRDSGTGMPADVMDRMFDPFFSTKSTGRGLGLAATLGILNSHGGAIDVRSEEGQGTTVRVMLPLASAAPATAPSVDGDSIVWTGDGTVLVVDDDVAVRAAARRALARAGYEVIEAHNGRDALSLFSERAVDIRCIVLDIAMPVMTGDVCLQELRSRDEYVPVILSTGFDAEDVARGLVELGHASFLQKPYTATGLLRAVRDAMAGGSRVPSGSPPR
jgi:PAS domain S-box-containing protein